MKTSELFEQVQRRKSDEEKAALRSAPDYWRIQLRKELTQFNQMFGILLRKSYAFSRHDPNLASFGGEYNFLVSGSDSLTLSKEKRFELWKKAYAGKIHKMVQDGYAVYTNLAMEATKIKPTDTVDDILARLEFQLRYFKNPSPKHPLTVDFNIIVVNQK